MPTEPRTGYDLWSLIALYAAGLTLLVEVSYRLPAAALEECGRYVRKAG